MSNYNLFPNYQLTMHIAQTNPCKKKASQKRFVFKAKMQNQIKVGSKKRKIRKNGWYLLVWNNKKDTRPRLSKFTPRLNRVTFVGSISRNNVHEKNTRLLFGISHDISICISVYEML